MCGTRNIYKCLGTSIVTPISKKCCLNYPRKLPSDITHPNTGENDGQNYGHETQQNRYKVPNIGKRTSRISEFRGVCGSSDHSIRNNTPTENSEQGNMAVLYRL
ncbi:hypothetical protein AYI69_g9591 [Smittium culicis]|uniref:Uncharacterized protein n=1 Tax=Smittium culicis TaxID=133412 RepID=A0A1R1XBR3_9FUNG|nr:hypothetical protein AYI69_g9591 [Smittium culicis]